MVEHHLQKKIIAALVECETARYADLKPENIDGNTFTYHLRALTQQKLIVKNKDGKYALTNKGKLYGINSSVTKKDVLHQAHSIILLSIRDGNKWLLRKRLVQPMYGKIGFIHGEPEAGKTVFEAASETLKRRTKLSGEFAVKGSGFVSLQDRENELVAYSHFTLLEVTNLQGTLKASDSHGENRWLEKPDFASKDMIPSMGNITEQIKKPGVFFVDLNYEIK